MSRTAKFFSAEELQAMGRQQFEDEHKRVRAYCRRLLHESMRNNQASLARYKEFGFFFDSLEIERKRIRAREVTWRPYEKLIEAEWKRRTDILIEQHRAWRREYNAHAKTENRLPEW